ncbi:M28 family peptidase [Plesiocystis pacifica]|uniref:M28 family peptidase n=1 Tax=Plesiocystis pacifica TaxID=191768 RepID=UPI0018DCED18|nr:M28 family peptidase [Plesiocystis pacifica]
MVRSLRFASLALPFLAACHPAGASSAAEPGPQEAADPGSGPALSVAFLRSFTESFSRDELGGRLPGSEGAAQAVGELVAAMEAIGLEPAGDGGGWTQAVSLRGVSLDRAASRLEIVSAGGAAGAFAFAQDWVGTSFAAGTARSLDAELVFVGYGVSAPEYDWDDYAGVDVRGKVVLAFVGDPPTEDGRFGGPAMTYYGRWTYKFERALEAGAAGCLVIHEDAPASYGWNVPTTSYSGERFHVLDGEGQPPPALDLRGWISAGATDALAKAQGASLEQWHAQAMAPEFAAAPLGVRLRGELRTSERQIADVNVLGRLPGSDPEHADEAVFVTAHWDHMGTDADKLAAGEDGIYNGAVDNASGIAGMLGVAAQLRADQLAGEALPRSAVFLATTAEEQGLLGSRYFVANPTLPLDDVVAVINIDSMNVFGQTRAVEIVGWGQTTLEERVVALAGEQGRAVIPDRHPASGGFYRSDHFPFALAGVPALYFHSSLDMVEGGTAAGDALGAGMRERYHTPADEFDPTWSFEGALQDAQLVVALIRQLGQPDATPRYKPESEFAGKR